MSDSTAARTDTDEPYLARAIELAGRGLGRVSPNPLVGAVVVKGGDETTLTWSDPNGTASDETAGRVTDLSGVDWDGLWAHVLHD